MLLSSFHERRMQAVLNWTVATHCTELGRLDQARDNLSAATVELGADPKLALACEAAWAYLMARRGRSRVSAIAHEGGSARARAHPRDNSTRLDCLEQLGQAMILMGEFEGAKECWEQFLATTHPPVAEPTGRYQLGVCQWHLGDATPRGRVSAAPPPRESIRIMPGSPKRNCASSRRLSAMRFFECQRAKVTSLIALGRLRFIELLPLVRHQKELRLGLGFEFRRPGFAREVVADLQLIA